MLTPQKIQDLADPIESIYISMTNELLVNIGRHLTSPTWTHTAAWEIQKLSELGQLTRENAAIINEWAKQIPPEVRATMEETRRLALEGIEKDLAKAAEDGYVTPTLRDSTVDVLNTYGQQAVDKMNMVNTTMLESSVNLYRQGIATVMSEEQAAQAQGILNEETGAVVTGTETRTQALQRAIGRINDAGITGFYDRAGRSWSAEAYVNMDIRTTVHNTAIQSVKNRMDDYGVSVFQVSAHAGARPLCYPYQGKMYSWNNTYGDFEDGNGRRWSYEPLNKTTYGQAAGLFGVNCGHEPIVMIPGITIPHAQDFVQPKDENDKAYAESQEQRALERKIRAAKRAIEMGDDSPEAKQKVKDAQKEMREFINRTGRTRRYDREQLYGAKKAPTVSKEKENVNSQLTAPTTFKGKIDEIKAGIVDRPTTEQIHKAGDILAQEYSDFAKDKQPEYDKRLETMQANIDALAAKETAIRAEIDKIDWSNFTNADAERLDRLNNEKLAVMRQRRQAEYDLTVAKMNGPISQKESVAWLSGKLSEIREIGPTDSARLASHLNNSRSSIRKNIEYAYSNYPRDWVDASFDRGQLTPKKTSRGYYSDWRKEIAISGYDDESSNRTSFHELGHRFERVVSGLRDQEAEFYNRRTAGESLQWLGPGYDRSEKSRRDKFESPYMGKDYGGSAYELVSMGFQYAFTEPHKLAKDPDMQSWIYGLLALM